jgi:hypothetical protein
MAQEKYGNKPGIKIVPIGVDYGHYQHFRSTLFVNVGEPMEVSVYNDLYAENPVAAVNELKDRFAESLSKLMIDIQTEEYYDLYMHLRNMYNDQMRHKMNIGGSKLADRFSADKRMIDILNLELESEPDNISRLNRVVTDYQDTLKKWRLRDWVIKKGHFSLPALISCILLKVILLPVVLIGFLGNILPYAIAASRVKNIKDTQFHSSFKYVVGMLVFPLWYLILGGILALFDIPIWEILIFIAALPVLGLAAFRYYINGKKLFSKIRFTFRRNTPEMQKLVEMRNLAITGMYQIINKHFHENTR